MEVYDSLPAVVREALANAPRNFSPEPIDDALAIGSDERDVLLFIERATELSLMDHYGRLMREVALDVPYDAPENGPMRLQEFYEHSPMADVHGTGWLPL